MLSAANTTAPNSPETSEMANNIVIFPKPFVVPPVTQINRTFMTNERFIQMHAELIADKVVEYLFSLAQEKDIPLTVSTDDQLQHFTLMLTAEAIKSVIYRVYDIRHPLHPVCVELFGTKPEEDEG